MLNLTYASNVNKILNSKAFARYIDKTQVAYLVQNDHISQRSLHVQLVSRLARELGWILGLNVDLIEAISLGHDVGHPPFGHEGEGYLSDLSIEFGQGSFSHPHQSCRLLTLIEPLDLELEVLDGFLCHDGGMKSPIYSPHPKKSRQDHLDELRQKKENPDVVLWPMTLEGCLVKLCDTVSYLVRDIEDAVILKLISLEDLPSTCLGKGWQEMLFRFKADLMKNSEGKQAIVLSDECFEALLKIRSFNFNYIYLNPKLKVESERIKKAYRSLFTELLSDFREKQEKSFIWREFLDGKSQNYLDSTNQVQQVVDYVAGMTDRYFLATLQHFLIPSTIRL